MTRRRVVMFGIGTWELIVILVLALIVLGPEKLPDMARKVGRTMARLRRTADEVKREIDLEGLGHELTQDEDLRELQESLDVRAQMRRAVAELELAPADDATPATPATPAAPATPALPARDPDGPPSHQ